MSQVRECGAKISTRYYHLVVLLLIVQLVRISFVEILVILLASTRLKKGVIILFNALYSCITSIFEF